jgi:hypothetical protein
MQTETKIKKLIANSLFLNEEQKKKLMELLKKASKEEKKGLLAILEEEETAARAFIENNGKDTFKRVIQKAKRKTSNCQEKEEKQEENKVLENLLTEL